MSIKRLLFLSIIILFTSNIFGQIKIGNNPTKIDSNSLLELESNNKGLLLPRLTNAQIKTLTKVPDGMTVYNSDSNCLFMRISGVWTAIESKSNQQSDMEDLMGCVFVHKFCTIGDGSITNPWKSKDSSCGIKEALSKLTPTKRILYFKPGYYATTGNVVIDYSKLLPNLSNTYWKIAFSGYGIEFQGHLASIYVNGGLPLKNHKPGIFFDWKGENGFYWKYTGLQFFGNVDTALVQWGDGYSFPMNGCDFDISGNNGYVDPNYKTKMSPSCAIKICEPLECRLHLVGVSATGSGVCLVNSTFCTISGAFSNTIVPGTNTNYKNSYGLNLINCQSNTITHMDLEVVYNGIRFDQWSIQNTFSAIFVSQGDSTGATFDNSSQVTKGKNVVISIRSGPTVQAPSKAIVQKLFTKKSDSSLIKVENYFAF